MAAVPTFPDFNVTGAVHHWVRMPNQGIVKYLGTAEVTPKVHEDIKWRDVFNDMGGKEIPVQRTKQGRIGVIGVLLNRYSKFTWGDILMAGSDTVAAPGTPTAAQVNYGQEGRFSRGSLAFGVSSFELWQVFDNATSPVWRQAGMELGYYWPQVLVANQDRDTLGTEVEKLLLVFEAYPQFVPQANAGSVQGYERSWKLYSVDDADFPNDVLVPQ